jgi:hypothetical protein
MTESRSERGWSVSIDPFFVPLGEQTFEKKELTFEEASALFKAGNEQKKGFMVLWHDGELIDYTGKEEEDAHIKAKRMEEVGRG